MTSWFISPNIFECFHWRSSRITQHMDRRIRQLQYIQQNHNTRIALDVVSVIISQYMFLCVKTPPRGNIRSVGIHNCVVLKSSCAWWWCGVRNIMCEEYLTLVVTSSVRRLSVQRFIGICLGRRRFKWLPMDKISQMLKPLAWLPASKWKTLLNLPARPQKNCTLLDNG